VDSQQKRLINSLILDLRESMEKELELSLRHYGIFVNQDWLDLEQLDFLSEEEKKKSASQEKNPRKNLLQLRLTTG